MVSSSRLGNLASLVLAFGVVALPAAAAPDARPLSASDACLKIADAKVREWNQPRLLRDRTDTLVDGSQRTSEAVVTENEMFVRMRGRWVSAQVLRAQRRVGSPENVAAHMELTGCRDDGKSQEAGQNASVYAFSLGTDATGQIWISDQTGLPVRMDIKNATPPADKAVEVSMRYTYGDDVRVPPAARLADSMRQQRSQNWVRRLQHGQGASESLY